jgi:hypothetical protein
MQETEPLAAALAPKLSDSEARRPRRLQTALSSRQRKIIAELSGGRVFPLRKAHSGFKRRMQVLRRWIRQLQANRGTLKL